MVRIDLWVARRALPLRCYLHYRVFEKAGEARGRLFKRFAAAGIFGFLLRQRVAGARAAKAADIEIDKLRLTPFPI